MKKNYIIKSAVALSMLAISTSMMAESYPGNFALISESSQLTDGYYVIAATDNFAMNCTNAGSYFTHSPIEVIENEIVNPDKNLVWKIESSEAGKYTIYSETTSKYVSYTGSSNAAQAVDAATTNAQNWTLAYDANKTYWTANNAGTTDRLLQYNASSPRFACYTGSQKNLRLFKLQKTSGLTAPTIEILTNDFGYNQTDPFVDQTIIQIENQNPTGQIYYTVDDSEPSASNGNLYTTPLKITTSCVLKAIVTDGTNSSSILTKTFTALDPAKKFTTIAALKANGINEKDVLAFVPNKLTFYFAANVHNYFSDGTDMILIYDSKEMPSGLIEGTTYTGAVTGVLGEYQGLSQVKNIDILKNFEATTDAPAQITPIEATIAQIMSDYSNYEHKLVTVKDVTATEDASFTTSKTGNANFKEGETAFIVRNQYKTVNYSITSNKSYDVTGFVGININNNTTNYQIFPRSEADIVESTGTSINSAKDNTFAISMTNGAVVITTNIETTVRIFQTSGQLVKTTTIPAGDTTIALPSGVYIINGKKAVVL